MMRTDRREIVWEGPCGKCGKLARLTFQPRNARDAKCRECYLAEQDAAARPEGANPQVRAKSAVPDRYLDTGYFVASGGSIVRPELMLDTAKEIAQAMVSSKVSMAQLRRYFNMSRHLENRSRGGEGFPFIANELRRMYANTAAVVGRVESSWEREALSRTLMSFIEQNVAQAVKSEAAFRLGFVPHFECVLAWFIWFSSLTGGDRRGS